MEKRTTSDEYATYLLSATEIQSCPLWFRIFKYSTLDSLSEWILGMLTEEPVDFFLPVVADHAIICAFVYHVFWKPLQHQLRESAKGRARVQVSASVAR